jgi:hypothetical protein
MIEPHMFQVPETGFQFLIFYHFPPDVTVAYGIAHRKIPDIHGCYIMKKVGTQG